MGIALKNKYLRRKTMLDGITDNKLKKKPKSLINAVV